MKNDGQTNTVLEPRVIFEDKWLVVVDKPAGMVVNRAESVEGLTVQDWHMGRQLKTQNLKLKAANIEMEELFIKRGGVVHRLDKETSGVMVLSKTPEALVELMRQFKERETQKEYVALVHGKLVPKEGFVSVPMRRTTRDRRKFGVGLGGKMTRTDYRVLEEFVSGNSKYSDGFCLVELLPKTGRTHQLRVLLKHLQHPIVADDKYLGGKRLREDNRWCQRLFLHAKKLGFNHPKSGKWVEFEAELSGDLTRALEAMN